MPDESSPVIYEHKFGSIRTPSDLLEIPGYKEKVDFSESAGRRLEVMIDRYDFSKENEYPCGIKACATKHQHGYLVKTSDGILTNIGNRCGKKFLNLDFDRVKKEYTARRKAFDNRASLTMIRNEFNQYQSRIDRLTAISAAFENCKAKLLDVAPMQLSEAIQLSRKGVRDVSRTRRMSKREAAIHYELTKTSSKDYPGRRPTIEEIICRISGGEIFQENINAILSSQIVGPLTKLTDISEFSFSMLNDRALEDLSRESNKAIRAITMAEQLVNKGIAFYSGENLVKLTLMGADSLAIESCAAEISMIVDAAVMKPE